MPASDGASFSQVAISRSRRLVALRAEAAEDEGAGDFDIYENGFMEIVWIVCMYVCACAYVRT